MSDTIVPVLHRPYVRRIRNLWWGKCTSCRWERVDPDRDVVLTDARGHHAPALQFLLDPDLSRVGRALDYGPGGFCPDCPFRDPAPSYEEREGGYIDNDPTEAHYDCRLLGRQVWGEYSPCTNEEWQRQAGRELTELLPVLSGRSSTTEPK